MKRWWAGDRGEVTEAQIDLRIGGRWRWVMTANGGFEVAFSGEYLEIDRPQRLVKTEVFELVPDTEAVSTTTFDESDGTTTMKILARYPSKEHAMQPSHRGWRVASKPHSTNSKNSSARLSPEPRAGVAGDSALGSRAPVNERVLTARFAVAG